ncbi:NAD-dependent epimerase/dehydratase family protein [Sphingobacterium sp. SYP-B4668]|uniref:NAD-dependent epimerase/dehydratase family protein n=1 Tax=Sphingobacterium sp. SYP-B4668 TaxID=2996035 RepID=UPI0022DE455B|nr:NAD-dependent epimerase/dehydratase family protein [Sphingobacterium sp. SYP-B4668]
MISNLKVIITGATGMVGEGVLQECIVNPKIEKILLINRKESNYVHPKIEQIIINNFSDISAIAEQFVGYDACYFCLGVSVIGMSEEEYTKVTYHLTLDFARQLAAINPQMTFCYVSGSGTDSSETGTKMWARVKGKTENDLMSLPLNVYNFRPAFMNPTPGAKNVKGFYKAIGILFPLFRFFSKTYFLTLEEVAKAMIEVTSSGYEKHILEVQDIALLSKVSSD